MIVTFVLCAAIAGQAQESSSPPPPAQTTTTPQASATPKTGASRYSPANGFLIRGTVFNDKALSFPNVELRIRRTGEKKYRWQSYTDSRGEFAMRVPIGGEYEMVVHTKGFKDQMRTINAKNGLDEENSVFRMEPLAGEKK
jgi:hypothetical protein